MEKSDIFYVTGIIVCVGVYIGIIVQDGKKADKARYVAGYTDGVQIGSELCQPCTCVKNNVIWGNQKAFGKESNEEYQ